MDGNKHPGLNPRFSLYGDLDYGYGDSISTDEDNRDEGLEDDVQLWDSFKCTEPQARTGSMVEKRGYEVLLRIVKFALYGLLLLLTLVGSIVAKASALFATSQLSGRSVPYCHSYPGRNPHEQYLYESSLPKESRIPWVWCLIFAFSAPELLNFLRFLWNYFFVSIRFPKFRYLGLLTLVEVLHSLGLALLFLVVLPDLDVIQAAAALSCVCLIPSVLGLITSYGLKLNYQRPLLFYGDVAAVCCQLGGILAFTYIAFQTENAFAPWLLPVALILSSLRWWGNFVAADSDFAFIRWLVLARRNIQAFRPVLIGFTALLRVITFLLCALLISTWQGIEPNDFFKGFNLPVYNYTVSLADRSQANLAGNVTPNATSGDLPGDRWIPLNVFLVNAVSSVLVYLCAKFACRTVMHAFGMALPLSLALPGTVAFLWLACGLRAYDECAFHEGLFSLPDYLFFSSPEIAGYVTNWQAYLWLLWFISQLWLTRHLWHSANRRLATPDRIFAVMSYDALLVDQSVALSRWREEPEDDDLFEKIDKYSYKKLPEKDDVSSTVRGEDYVTRLYACATMWHETAEEMTDFLNSILRMDRDQCIMRLLRKRYRIISPDYYELEVHVFFDDAFKCVHGCNGRCMHDENKTQVNDWVIEFVRTVEKCVRARKMRPSPPVKYPTPYGGRLLWILPEKTKMYVHLKDKNRIRTRKRWSQVMYMYYLLGYRLMELPISVERKEVRAENTYLLTLDGDIDFRPSAIRTLIDRMKINKDLGSACGRIHPLGKGPLVWFQQFEYAIGHWLQKSTEHTIGCVLCSPGCFALFRAKALMDYNVMRKYASVPEEARHFIQYDQGEDRWLCTLILQKGYKVEYSAASDAYTHAPEGFNEFFIQRRRWIPSTVANIMDLLETASQTKKANPDISSLYILYQWLLMGSTILGPGTIFLMLVGAFVSAFRIDILTSFYYNLIPVLLFCFICYFCKEKFQLTIAAIITALYGLLMIVVLVGIMIQISEDGWLAPTTVLFLVVIGEFVIAALMHPLEIGCLKYACIYYVTVPSMYLLLIVFSLFNMNNISWGTRDVPKPADAPQTEQQQAGQRKSSTKAGIVKNVKKEKGAIDFSIAGLFRCMLCVQDQPRENEREYEEITASLLRIEDRLQDSERMAEGVPRNSRYYYQRHRGDPDEAASATNPSGRTVSFMDDVDQDSKSRSGSDLDDSSEFDALDAGSVSGASVIVENDNFLVSPNWVHNNDLGKREVEFLNAEEEIFWKKFIGAYLEPIDKDEKREADIAKKIRDLRDQYIFKFFMINALFVLVIFLMQLNKDLLHLRWPIGIKYNITYTSEFREVHLESEYLRLEPIGFVFILGFLVVLLIQFIAMMFHRFDTFSHIMAKVSLDLNCCDKAMELSEEAINERMAEKLTKELEREIDKDANLDDPGSSQSPRKRMTIHNTINDTRPRQSYAKSFGSALQKNLDSGRADGKGGIISKRLSQALQRKRKTVLADMEQQQQQQQMHQQRQAPPKTGDTEIYGNSSATANPPQEHSPAESIYGIDNHAFVKDDDIAEEI